MAEKKKINLGLTPASTLVEEAKKASEEWGRTDLYSTGDPILDEYLGNSQTGGYGRRSAYEIITIFGDTGMNKSTFASSLIIDPASKGTTVAYFALEDDPKDVVSRLMKQCDDEEQLNKVLDNVLFMPENDGYTLDMMAEAIEDIFSIADIVVIDPLQFIFEASVADDGLHGIRLWKTRFTPYRFSGVQIRLDHMRIKTVYDLSDLPQARAVWTGGAVSTSD